MEKITIHTDIKKEVDLQLSKETGGFNPTWDKLVSELGRGYHYNQPYIDSAVSVRDGDDIWVDKNIIVPAVEADKFKMKNSLVDQNTLVNPNIFGTYARFTDSNGAGEYGNRYTMDLNPLGNHDDHWAYQMSWLPVTFDGDLALRFKASVQTSANKYSRHTFNQKYGHRANYYAEVYVPSTNVDLDRITWLDNNGFTLIGSTNGLKDQWVTIQVNGRLSTGGTSYTESRFYCRNASNANYTPSTTQDVFYIRNVDIHWYELPEAVWNYAIDHYTGFGWPMGVPDRTYGQWNGTIDRLLGTDHGGGNNRKGYTDWFMASLRQIQDVKRYDYNKAFSWPLYSAMDNGSLTATSTNEPSGPGDANQVSWRNSVSHGDKEPTYYYAQYCRKHF